MQIVVLAGGLGTRLRPLTGRVPKCMAVVAGKPFLYYLLRLLKARGAEEVVLCTGYLGEQVERYFGRGREVGLKLRYSREQDVLLGTGGALKLASPLLQESFLVVNGDTYLDIDYTVVLREFDASRNAALIVASPGNQDIHCDLSIDTDMMVTSYDKSGCPGLNYANAGVMGLRREVVNSISPRRPVSLETEVLPHLIRHARVKALITQQKFYDIGSFAGLDTFANALGAQP